MENALLEIWKKEKGQIYRSTNKKLIDNRLAASEKYSWGIPNDEALNEISKYSPIIEIGAGLGYWASLLRERGTRIIPTDIHPPREGWTRIYFGGAKEYLIGPYQNRTLFMCWVPKKIAKTTAEIYKGNIILWVGELIYLPEFTQIKKINIPQWIGFKDALFIFKRKEEKE